MRKMNMTKIVIAVILVASLAFPPVGYIFGAHAGQKSVKQQPLRPQEFVQNEILFKTEGRVADAVDVLKKYKLKLIRRDQKLGYILASTPNGTDIKNLVKAMSKDKYISYAQPNYIYRLFRAPKDPQYSRQWAMKKINAEQGWDVVKVKSQVTIAILDTGIDVNHPDLKSKLVTGTNTVNPLKSTRDAEGHGTHVAGIAGAVSNNGVGVAGVAGINGIKIMPLKVFDGDGGSDTTISDAIIWAADHGAKVMNMSFGSFYRSEILNDAIDYAYDKGVVMVAAAGNWATEEISYPAALSKVIAVSAIDKNDNLASFSSFGPQIDVCAPGEGIFSTVWDTYKGSTYTEMSGTSMAAPMVAGLAALLLANDPDLTNDDVRQILEASATDLGEPGWDPKYGHGKINVYKALTTSLENIDDGNGTMETAIKLTEGITVSEKLDYGQDIDWFKINVPGKSHLQVEVLPAGKVSPGVEIRDSEGEIISAFNSEGRTKTNDAAFFDEWGSSGNLKVAEAVYGLVTDLEKGDYYIKVFGNHFRWSEDNYFVTARIFTDEQLVKDLHEPNDSPEKAVRLDLMKPVMGTMIEKNGEPDVDFYKITLPGTAYKIHVDVPEGLDIAIDVESTVNYIEPSSEDEYRKYLNDWYFDTINNGGPGVDEDGLIVVPKHGGEYYIIVYETSGASVNDKYALTLSSFNFTADSWESNETWKQAAAISINEEIKANFHRKEDEDWYQFQVLDTGVLKISLKEPKKVWYDLNVYSDPEGIPLSQWNGFEYEFGYGLDFDLKNDRDRTFEFKVTPGTYYINVSNYERLSADDYGLKAEFSEFNFIDRELNDSPLKAIELDIGNVSEGTLYPAGDVDFYVVDVKKPQPFLVYLTPPAELDTSVFVGREMQSTDSDQADESSMPEEPFLEPIANINSGGKGQSDIGVFNPSRAGKYYILVTVSGDSIWQNKSQSSSEGRYSLTVKPFISVPDPWEDNDTIVKAKLLNSGTMVNPTFMGTEDQDWFKIYVPGEGMVGINLSVPSDIDGVVELYDAAGKYIGKIDHSMIGEEEAGTFKVIKPGYYYVKTYDYLGNSSVLPYSLTVRYLETIPPKISNAKVKGNTVSFKVSENAKVWAKVLNGQDHYVGMIVDGQQVKQGMISATWNGLDAHGRKVKPGTYKVKLMAMDGSGNMSTPVYVSIKV